MSRPSPLQVAFDLRKPGLTAGVDEAGRGPLAGPVVAAAVILDPRRRIRGIADSKVLAAQMREELELKIKDRCLAFGLGWADPAEIDAINILQATMLAMRRALLALPCHPAHVMIDGDRCPGLAGTAARVHDRGGHRRRRERRPASVQRRSWPRPRVTGTCASWRAASRVTASSSTRATARPSTSRRCVDWDLPRCTVGVSRRYNAPSPAENSSPPPMARFVHLHLHTEYSLVDGVVRIESEKKDDGSLQREGPDRCDGALRDAGRRGHRPGQPVLAGQVLQDGPVERHQAARRRRRAGARGGRAQRAEPHRAALPGQPRLPQPHAAGHAQLPRGPGQARRDAVALVARSRYHRRPDRALRRARR